MQVTDSHPDLSLVDLFSNLSYDEPSWPEAHLEDCVCYLRTAKRIKVPAEFKELIPKVAMDFDLLG